MTGGEKGQRAQTQPAVTIIYNVLQENLAASSSLSNKCRPTSSTDTQLLGLMQITNIRKVNKCFAIDTMADIQTDNHTNSEVVSRTETLKTFCSF